MSREDIPATVDIVDAFADAVRLEATALRSGDYVFDVFGGRHKLIRVARHARSVTITREDGHWERIPNGETITVARTVGGAS